MTRPWDRTNRASFHRAVKWAYAMTLGQRGIATALTFVLAAILGPRDFGTIAMATAYVLFIEMLVVQGMPAAIIQRKDLTPAQLDSVFWMVLAAGGGLALGSVALSGWWASVNQLPELAAVIRVLSLLVIIRGLTVVQQALLQRRMDFRGLAVINSGAAAIGGGIGVVLALNGAGVWALVAQQLIDAASGSAMMWMRGRWRPRLRFSWRDARPILGFSGSVFASHAGVYAATQSDALLMGVFFGPVAVGLYRLADRAVRVLLEVSTRSIQIVALPHLSALQDDRARLRALARAGCVRVHLGVESGNDWIRKEILGRPIEKEEIVEAFRLAKSYGLKTVSFNMIGVPHETDETIWETIELNRRLRPHWIHLSVFIPYPGTPLFDYCKARGWRGEVGADYYDPRNAMDQPGLSRERVFEYFERFFPMVYGNDPTTEAPGRRP